MTFFRDAPKDWQQGNTPNSWGRADLPQPGTSTIHAASKMDQGNLRPSKDQSGPVVHVHLNRSGDNNMRTHDQPDPDDLAAIMQRLDQIEQALIVLAGGTVGEGEEGSEGEEVSMEGLPIDGSDTTWGKPIDKGTGKGNPTTDRRMARRWSTLDRQCARTLASINDRNRKHYGIH